MTSSKPLGDRLGEANVLKAIGDVQQFRDDRDAALASYQQALDLFKAVGAKLGEANVYLATGRLQGEPEYFEQAIAIYRHIGDAYSAGRGQYLFGVWLLDAGQTERALELLAAARQIWSDIGFEGGMQAVDGTLAQALKLIPDSVRQALADYSAAQQAAVGDELVVERWQAAAQAGEGLLLALAAAPAAAPAVPGLSLTAAQAEVASAYNTLGNAYDAAATSDKTAALAAALAAYDRAIAWQPDFAMWHRNRAGTLIELRRLEEAAAAIETARQLGT